MAIVIAIFVSTIIIQYIKICRLKSDNEIAKLSIKEIRNNYELRIKLSECDSSQVDALEKKNAALLMENMQLRSAISAYRNAYGRTRNMPQISKDTMDAVRYAMKHAHPDNGGSAEDFVRFKKCYEELTGR